MTIADQVFIVRQYEYQVIVAGKVIAATWPDRGSALAGLQVEQRRAAKRAAATHTKERQ